MYDAMMAETVMIAGHNGDKIEAYLARPLNPGPSGGVVVIHHLPGYDEATREITRRFAANGYAAICPNLFWRYAPGADPGDAAAAARAAGGAPDDQVVGDVGGAARYLRELSSANKKVGVIGYCSGGRHAFLSACRLPLDAAVDCYGAFVAGTPPDGAPPTLTPVIGLAGDLSCPVMGLFGADDEYPSPEDNAEMERELVRQGKTYEIHTFEGAGHAFFAIDRPSYRVTAATEGWLRVFDFFGRHL